MLFFGNGTLEVPDDADIIEGNPGLETTATRNFNIINDDNKPITVQTGATLSVYPITSECEDGLPQKWRVSIIQDASQSSERKDQLNAYGGLLGTGTLTLEDNPVILPFNFDKQNFRDPDEGELKNGLFPRKDSPSIDEIKQGDLGNCYLLAVLINIISQPGGKEFIRSMIRLDEDGKHATVRLFDPTEKKAQYIRVSTAILTKTDALRFSGYQFKINAPKAVEKHDCLAIHLIIKAYCVLAVTVDNKEEIIRTEPSYRIVYGNGGIAGLAARVITGGRIPKNHWFEETPKLGGKPEGFFFPWVYDFLKNSSWLSYARQESYEDIEKGKIGLGALPKIFSILAASNKDNEIVLWQTKLWLYFVDRHAHKYAEIYKNQQHKSDIDSEVERLGKLINYIRSDAFSGHIEKVNKVKNPLREDDNLTSHQNELIIIANVFKEKTLSYKPYMSEYTVLEKGFLGKIKGAHQAGNVICASTNQAFKKGEGKGVCDRHAYAFLEVLEKYPGNYQGQEALIYIVLCNPWNEFVRREIWHYGQSTPEIDVKEGYENGGIFEMELRDFMHHFRGFYRLEVPLLFELAAIRERFLQACVAIKKIAEAEKPTYNEQLIIELRNYDQSRQELMEQLILLPGNGKGTYHQYAYQPFISLAERMASYDGMIEKIKERLYGVFCHKIFSNEENNPQRIVYFFKNELTIFQQNCARLLDLSLIDKHVPGRILENLNLTQFPRLVEYQEKLDNFKAVADSLKDAAEQHKTAITEWEQILGGISHDLHQCKEKVELALREYAELELPELEIKSMLTLINDHYITGFNANIEKLKQGQCGEPENLTSGKALLRVKQAEQIVFDFILKGYEKQLQDFLAKLPPDSIAVRAHIKTLQTRVKATGEDFITHIDMLKRYLHQQENPPRVVSGMLFQNERKPVPTHPLESQRFLF